MTGLVSRCEQGRVAWGSIDGESCGYTAVSVSPRRSGQEFGSVGSWRILGTGISRHRREPHNALGSARRSTPGARDLTTALT